MQVPNPIDGYSHNCVTFVAITWLKYGYTNASPIAIDAIRSPIDNITLLSKRVKNYVCTSSQVWGVLNALGLALVTALVATAVNYISRETKLFEVLPVQWDLLVTCLLVLSPIWAIAYIHHLVNLLLEAFLSDAQRAERDRLTGIFPTIVSWWEGMYAWMAINIATITVSPLAGYLSPFTIALIIFWAFCIIFTRCSSM